MITNAKLIPVLQVGSIKKPINQVFMCLFFDFLWISYCFYLSLFVLIFKIGVFYKW